MDRMKLRIPQKRLLLVLAKGRPILNRLKLAQRAGLSEISATVWRALNGVREGSSTGDPRPGLLELGLVEKMELDVDGVVEQCYRITDAGLEVARQLEADELPEIRSRQSSLNKRYEEIK